jgi:hypothetical protein
MLPFENLCYTESAEGQVGDVGRSPRIGYVPSASTSPANTRTSAFLRKASGIGDDRPATALAYQRDGGASGYV